jgi:tRNA A-37 threonylcarbamoyl transferase component Bud32
MSQPLPLAIERGGSQPRVSTLAEWLADKPLTVSQAVQVLRALAISAADAHKKGVSAGAFSPEHIRLREPSAASTRWTVACDFAPPDAATSTPFGPHTVQGDLAAIGAVVSNALLALNRSELTQSQELEPLFLRLRPDVLPPLVETLRRTSIAHAAGGFGSAQELLAACADLEPTNTLAGPPLREAGGVRARLRVDEGDASASVDMDAKLAEEEHVANVLRLRKICDIASFVWPSFFLSDWLMATYIHPSPFVWFFLARTVAWCFPLYVAYRLRQAPMPSPGVLARYDALGFGSAGVAISIMCVMSGGLTSIYAAGLPVVLMSRNTFVAVPWRASLVSGGIAALSYPLAQVAGVFISAELGAQWRDPAALSAFAFYNSLVFTAFFYTVAGGHAVWALRRQIFAARNLGRYRLVRCIGRGGMGEVWVAHHATLRRDVAVKIMRGDRASSAVALQRFEREVQATTGLTHPNTIRVFDYGATEDGLWYYAMELLEGEDLRSLVMREGALGQARSVQIILQVSGALAEAHAQGIVHRDIKPANVFVCRAGGLSDFVKVLDFGVVKLMDSASDGALTHTERLVGTPQYISPEVAVGKSADMRSDVYGLGALLYFLLTGQAPFEGEEGAALLLAHATRSPRPPSSFRDLPLERNLEQLVLRCLAKSPLERFQDAGELHQALQQLLPDIQGQPARVLAELQ